MLNTASVELANSIDCDLTWKTVRKGFRSSTRKPARRLGVGGQWDDRSTKKKSSSVSESEKFGVDVLGRHFTGKVGHVPIKKRRLMLPRPGNPSHHGETLSSQSQSPPPAKNISSGQCCGAKSVSELNCPTANQFSQGSRDGDGNIKHSQVTNTKPIDLSGIMLLADVALQSIHDDTLEAKGSLAMGDPSTPVPSLETSPLRKTSTSEGTTALVQEVLAHGDSIDDSEVHVNGLDMSAESQKERYRDAEKMPASGKEVRLHWDLNTVMESWELPDDGCLEGMPTAVECRENLEKLEGRVVHCDPSVELSKHSTEAEISTQVISTNEVSLGIDCLKTQSSLLCDLVVPQKITLETINTQSKGDLVQVFGAPEKGTSPTDSLAPATNQMLDSECPAIKLGTTGLYQASPEHDNLSSSGTTFEEGQPAVAGGIEDSKEAPAEDAAQKDYFLFLKHEKVPKIYNFLGEASVEDCDYGSYDSDVSQGGHGHAVAVENRTDIQIGYESPFEDGELRESDIYAHRENEENDVEGEPECVDYVLNERDAEEFDASNHCLSEVASEGCQIDKGSSTEKIMYSAIPLNESSYLLKLKEFSGDQSPDVHEHYINRSVGAGHSASQENISPDQVDRLIVRASYGEAGPRETRGRTFRQPEESLYSGGTHRQNNTYLQRGRYRYDTSFHAGKFFGSGKPLRRHQDENEGGHHWVGSCGNLRKPHPAGNDGPLDDEDRRQRSGIAFSAEKADRPRYQRRLVHHPSSNFQQPFRRRSPSDRDDYSPRRRVVASRDGSHFRRGRPGMYRHGVSRVPKDEYYGPICDSPPSSSVQQPNYSARRERSFSPVLSRENSLSHPRRRSRSRSSSPPVWHLQRERTLGMSPPGRSTDFRSDTRVERARIPFRKSNFAADDEFMASPPRRRFSPPCQPRWIDNRKCYAPDFRGRKSPGRFSVRSQRFHAGGSPERMKSDDCYRSKMRPGRFSELSSGGGGRGRKYDASNRMKYHDRYEFPNRPRQYETSPVPRRFSYDAED